MIIIISQLNDLLGGGGGELVSCVEEPDVATFKEFVSIPAVKLPEVVATFKEFVSTLSVKLPEVVNTFKLLKFIPLNTLDIIFNK